MSSNVLPEALSYITIFICYFAHGSLCQAPFIYASDNGIHYVGDLVTVMCTGFHEFSAVHWIQTNTQYEHFQSDIEINTVRTISYIFINNITHDYNNTAIRCEGSYTNGQSFSSAVATILLQGVLDPVSNLTTATTCDNNVDITWTAPYSIDVPSTEPDITYCVDIFNTSSTSQTIFYSRCDINQTYHHVSSRLSAYAEYQMAVSAVNRIGSSSTTSMTLVNRVKALKVTSLSIKPQNKNVKSIHANLSDTICWRKAHVLADEDIVDIVGHDNNTSITFQLPDNRHYNSVILHINISIEIYTISFGAISTYDTAETNISVIQRNFLDTYSVLVKCSFLMETQAKGVVLAFMYLTEYDGIDFSKTFYFSVNVSLVSQGIKKYIPQGKYRILSYDIEEDNQIQHYGLPATVSILSVPEMDIVHHFNGDCEFHYLSSHNLLQLTCNCSSYTHYQAVLQIYDGLDPASVDNIESQRARCLQTLFFPVMNESFSHHITVFVESVDYGVLGAHVFFTGQVTPDQQLNSTSQNISPTRHPNAQTTILASAIVSTLLLVISFLLLMACRNFKRKDNIVHVSSPVVLNKVTPNSTAPAADTSYSHGNFNVTYSVAEKTSRIDKEPSYVVTQCPAYASLSTEHGQNKAGSHVRPASSSVKNSAEVINSQVPPASMICISQGNSNVTYEEVMESAKISSNSFNCTVTKCMAYELHKPVTKNGGRKGSSHVQGVDPVINRKDLELVCQSTRTDSKSGNAHYEEVLF